MHCGRGEGYQGEKRARRARERARERTSERARPRGEKKAFLLILHVAFPVMWILSLSLAEPSGTEMAEGVGIPRGDSMTLVGPTKQRFVLCTARAKAKSKKHVKPPPRPEEAPSALFFFGLRWFLCANAPANPRKQETKEEKDHEPATAIRQIRDVECERKDDGNKKARNAKTRKRTREKRARRKQKEMQTTHRLIERASRPLPSWWWCSAGRPLA